MDWTPPSCDKGYFVTGLSALCAGHTPSSRVWMTRHGPLKMTGKQSHLRCDTDPRLHIMIGGRHRIGGNFGEGYQEVDLLPGDVFFHPPLTLTQELWSEPCMYFGIIFRQSLVRYLVVDFDGGRLPVGRTPWVYHANGGLGGVGQHVLDALCAASEEADPSIVNPLVTALLGTALKHLEAPGQRPLVAAKSYHTWVLAMEYINLHYDQSVSREDVASAIGIHPNYLSGLCKQHAQRTFHELVENVRLDRARHYLEETDWKLEQIARRCGFPGAPYFVRVFSRAVGETPGAYRHRRVRERRTR